MLVIHRDWDHHNRIYAEGNHYKICKELDIALSSLLEDLATRKRPDGRTLLDDTLSCRLAISAEHRAPWARRTDGITISTP